MSATVPLVARQRRGPRARARTAGWRPRDSAATASAGSTTRWPRATRRIASASSVAGRVLQQEPGRAGLHRPPQVAGPAERRQDHHAAAGHGGPQLRGGREAVEPGHLDVEQRDVGPGLERPRHDLVPAADLGDDVEVGLEGKQRRERAAHHRLVLGEQHPDHVAASPTGDGTGTATRSRKPAAGDRARLEAATERGRPLAQPGEARAGAARPGVAGLVRPAVRAVVFDLDPANAAVDDHADARGRRVAVAQDVRDALPDRPAEDRVDVARQVVGRGLDVAVDAGRRERRPRARELHRQRRLRGSR